MKTLVLAAVVLVLPASPGRAQSAAAADRAPGRWAEAARSVAVDVLKDPTTYAPAVASEVGKSLDWISSQRFFAAGYVEHNPYYTVSGLPDTAPVSRAAGHRINAQTSLHVLASSVANNAVAGVATRVLSARWPKHRRVIATAALVERVAFAVGTAYVNSAKNFRQWRTNVHATPAATASQLGF